MKKLYNRIEKIGYYTRVLNRAYYVGDVTDEDIVKALRRLEYLTSDSYQEWDQRVSGEILIKKAASSK